MLSSMPRCPFLSFAIAIDGTSRSNENATITDLITFITPPMSSPADQLNAKGRGIERNTAAIKTKQERQNRRPRDLTFNSVFQPVVLTGSGSPWVLAWPT